MRARGCGCTGHPAFPAPSLEGRVAPSGRKSRNNSGASRGEMGEACLRWSEPGNVVPALRRDPEPLAWLFAEGICYSAETVVLAVWVPAQGRDDAEGAFARSSSNCW
jgi:hypothetical protein